MLGKKNLDRPPGRKPPWLRVRAPGGESYTRVRQSLRKRGLNTVCQEARCPNLGECWHDGTATFMLLGEICTRACSFCAVKTGNPRGEVDLNEPTRLAESVAGLGLDYVVLTTVDRDDLEDGGAAVIADTVRAIRHVDPGVLVEVLTGDFRGDRESIRAVVDAMPTVFAHNIETVERLTPSVRDRRASYRLSLEVLAQARVLSSAVHTKSSIMLGLGETEAEVISTMRDLRGHSVEMLTIGQYLRPSVAHLPVEEYVRPEQFDHLREVGLELGFSFVASGPLVRSSYRAAEHFVLSRRGEGPQGPLTT